MENIMEALMKRIDYKWGCKTEGCHKTCDSHPCLLQQGLKYRYCEDCKTVFNYWKARANLEPGHEDHNVRILTLEEYLEVEQVKE